MLDRLFNNEITFDDIFPYEKKPSDAESLKFYMQSTAVEETKEDLEPKTAIEAQMDELLALQRQYQGSEYQKKQQIIEFEPAPNRPMSIRNQEALDEAQQQMDTQQRQQQEEEGSFGRFVTFIQQKLCGVKKQELQLDGTAERILESDKIKKIGANDKLIAIKADREKELHSAESGKETDDFLIIE